MQVFKTVLASFGLNSADPAGQPETRLTHPGLGESEPTESLRRNHRVLSVFFFFQN